MRKKLRTGRREFHGMAGTPTYVSYQEMLKRCYDESVIRYPNYGGRGITVCGRWRESFKAFLDDMGVKPEGFSLDRINTDGNYEPSNCRWADAKTQANNKTTNLQITFDGRTMNAQQWAEETGIPARIICQRLRRDKFSTEDALTRPNVLTHRTKKEKILRKRYQPFTANGKTQSLVEWARELKLNPRALLNRISSGRFTLEQALSKVSRKSKVNK